ncbi:hypothetical protein KVV02_004195 [Mortierella alpina]|uniref:Peroxisomal membrane protein PEX13 n=1 Tax=Mortierella alpina TaxID=64518 RepID=A0A9P8CZU2_MORAP|nr:hypothetical protein KVV02_004195 [Mortierella alpina]
MPEKPWERARQANPSAAGASPLPSLPAAAPASSASAMDAGPPALPNRSPGMAMGTASTVNRQGMNGYGTGYGSGQSGLGMTGYGSSYGSSSYSSPYNRMGGMGYGSSYGSSYSSPYSRMGGMGMGGMYGSSYGGGYGSSYGGYGSSYGGGGYGMNRMGMGMNGMNGMNGPMGPEEMTLMQRMEQGSAPTFQLIESVVGAFGGFAQMLESTFMATHSSFMAMVGVAEQFGHLRGYLGQVLSIFALLRWAKSLAYRLVGMKAPVNTQELTAGNFQEFQAQPRYSKRPIVIFLLAVFGLPYLMGRLIRALSSRNSAPEQGLLPGQEGQVVPAGSAAPVSPQNLDFARALYDFTPSNPHQELAFRRGDIIAILSRQDPMGQESLWWRGRLRSGEMGLFPSNYVEIINKGGNNNSNNPINAGGPNAVSSVPSAAAGQVGIPAQPTSQQAADIQTALAGSAFEEFKF